ncbi:MAG TPA: hypothetical protein VLJ86_02045 [Ramlibacter sp.]|nr:hypothetical protein [Ramlibacter sp.]
MSNPNESRAEREMRLDRRLAAISGVAFVVVTGALLQMSGGASAGVAPHDGDRIVPRAAPPAASNQKGPGTYQLRCWQYGRLLFDEGPVTLASETRQGARLVAIDRNGAALIVTDAGGTTCLARPSAAAPNLALPR